MKLLVVVHPNSKKERIETDLFGQHHIYVDKPPLEGKANMAVIVALAKYFKTGKNKVHLLKGAKSKQKLFEIED